MKAFMFPAGMLAAGVVSEDGAVEAVNEAAGAVAESGGVLGVIGEAVRKDIAAGGFFTRLLLIAAIILITLVIHRSLTHMLCKVERHMRENDNSSAALIGFARHIVSFLVYFAGIISAVSCIPSLANALKSVLTAGGVLAVVAGFASQEALSSMVSGIMILAFKPFMLGDVVRYIDNDISGVVEEITIHHTTIRTWENKRVIVPNSKMNSAIIENADYAESKVCVFLDIGVTYESDIETAKELLAAEIQKHPSFFDYRSADERMGGAPPVVVRVIELADSSVVLRAWLWAKDNGTAAVMKSDILQNVKRAYDRAGVDLAYPHLVVVSKGVSAQ